MADQTTHDLAPLSRPLRSVKAPVQPTDADTRHERMPISMFGGLETVAVAADADVALELGVLHLVDCSGWTQARRARLPATARDGEACGVLVTTAHGTHALEIVNATGQTINGTDHDVGPWAELDAPGEFAFLRCHVADTDWHAAPLVQVDEALTVHGNRTIGPQGGFAGTSHPETGDVTVNPLAGTLRSYTTGAHTVTAGTVEGPVLFALATGVTVTWSGFDHEIGTERAGESRFAIANTVAGIAILTHL